MPVLVLAAFPKKSTKTDSDGMVFWSARTPIVPASFKTFSVRKLPRANVSGQVEHTIAAALAFEKVFMAVQDHDFLDILLRVFGKAREFRGHPTKTAEHSPDG